ncbi:MAG: hypothetical protein WDO71_20140 [Bacteroidota bacterium]
MTGNVSSLPIDLIKFDVSKTFEQEFSSNVRFKSRHSVIIKRIFFGVFPNKSITNYIIWDYLMEGFIEYVATDTVFLVCDNFDNAEDLLTEFIKESFTRFKQKFDELQETKKLGFTLPNPSERVIERYRNDLIEELKNVDWY